MPLPYNNSTPQGNQTISSTQNPILQNFQSIGAAFNETAGNNFTKYQMQAALATNPVTAVNQGAIFTKTSNTKTELFYERDQGTAGAPSIPLTHLSFMKAWASFDGTTAIGAVPIVNGFNVASITKTAVANWDIVLSNSAVVDINYGVLCAVQSSAANGNNVWYTNVAFAAPVGSFSLRTIAGSPNAISFMVFQL